MNVFILVENIWMTGPYCNSMPLGAVGAYYGSVRVSFSAA